MFGSGLGPVVFWGLVLGDGVFGYGLFGYRLVYGCLVSWVWFVLVVADFEFGGWCCGLVVVCCRLVCWVWFDLVSVSVVCYLLLLVWFVYLGLTLWCLVVVIGLCLVYWSSGVFVDYGLGCCSVAAWLLVCTWLRCGCFGFDGVGLGLL